MHIRLLSVIILAVQCKSQVLQLGLCSDVASVTNFDLNQFLGVWYEIERFPIWYEKGQCAYKVMEQRGDRVEIKHHYVLDDIEFVLYVNSTIKNPNVAAIFDVDVSNIDTLGIPLNVVATDYTNYAVLYGCRHHGELHFRFVAAWILSRSKTLDDTLLNTAYKAINRLPQASCAYLEKVEQSEEKCQHMWTAHIED